MTSYDGHAFSALLTGSERDVPAETWYRPTEFKVEGNALVHDGQLTIPVRNGPGMLLHFTKLVTSDDVARYAKKWGPLGLCHEHPSEPVAHHQTSSIRAVKFDRQTGEHVPGCGDALIQEPIAIWLFYSRQFRGILRLARKLSAPGSLVMKAFSIDDLKARRNSIDLADVAEVFPDIAEAIAPALESTASSGSMRERFVLFPAGMAASLSFTVTTLLERTGSRIGLDWLDGQKPHLIFGSTSPTLLGALALQLAFTIAGEPDTFLCSTCGKPFDPSEQRVRRGFRPYCQECRDSKAPEREAARRYRQRKKGRQQ